MSLKEEIKAEMERALRSKDSLKLSVFRMLSSAIHNKEIEKRGKSGDSKDEALTEEEVTQVIRSELKKRKDAALAYEQGGRAESAVKEKTEGQILFRLLPAELADGEIIRIIGEGIKELGVGSPKELGKLMAWVMPRLKGQASGERVAKLIKERMIG